MSSIIERMSADVCPGGDPYALDTVTTSRRLKIPASMTGKFCAFTAEASTVYVRFGDETVEVSAAARSTVSTEALTADGKEPHLTIEAGSTVHWRIPASATHMADISADASGVFRFGSAQGGLGAD